jgi:hypothetical protein
MKKPAIAWSLLTLMTIAGAWIILAADRPGRAAEDKGEKKVDTRVFEMRTYYAAPGKMEALHARSETTPTSCSSNMA